MTTSEELQKKELAAREDWSTLIGKISDGLCTPVLGAGAAYSTLPLAKELAEDLLREEEISTGKTAPLPDRGDLAKVTEYIAVRRQDNVWPKVRIAKRLKKRGARISVRRMNRIAPWLPCDCHLPYDQL